MKIRLVIITVAIVVLFTAGISAINDIEAEGVSKAIIQGVFTEGNITYASFRLPEGGIEVFVIDSETRILLDENLITINALENLIKDEEYAVWVWSYKERISRLILSRNVYQIRIKAIDPGLKRLLSEEGRWYDVASDIAIHRLVAGESVKVYFSSEGYLDKILIVEDAL